MKQGVVWWVRLALFLAVTLGVAMTAWSFVIPEYVDPVQAKALKEGLPTDSWWSQMDEIRTDKWAINDLGIGILSFGLSLLFAMWIFNIRGSVSFVHMTTPSSTLSFLIQGCIIWTAFAASFISTMFRDLDRDYAPYWADSVGIPLSIIPGYFCLLPLVVLLGWLLLRNVPLPAPLWVWDRGRPWASITISVIFGLPSGVMIVLLMSAVLNGDFILVPASLSGLYLMLSARAALSNPGDQVRGGEITGSATMPPS